MEQLFGAFQQDEVEAPLDAPLSTTKGHNQATAKRALFYNKHRTLTKTTNNIEGNVVELSNNLKAMQQEHQRKIVEITALLDERKIRK